MSLVNENQFLVVYIPARNSAFVWRVKCRVNSGYEVLDYGPLPIKKDEVLPTYDGAATTVPEDGVLPARAYIPTGRSFPLPGAYDENDMWYLPEDYRERVFHVTQNITPSFLRVDVQIPLAVAQGRFQRDRVVTGVEKDFGFSRGVIETIHVPKIHYGYRWGNDTNLSVYTAARFTYGEYLIDVPRDAELIFQVLTRRIPSHWVTLPINVLDAVIERAFLDVYGYMGFPLYSVNMRDEALEVYKELLNRVRA